MGSIAAWLASLVPGLVSRVMLALGFGVLTVTGLNLAWGQVKASVLSNLGGVPADLAALAGLSGAGDGVGIILGAITARVAFTVLTQGAKIVGVSQ